MEAVYSITRACGHVSIMSFSAPTLGDIRKHRLAAMRATCIHCFIAGRTPGPQGTGRRVGHLTIVK